MKLETLTDVNVERAARRPVIVVTDTANGGQRLRAFMRSTRDSNCRCWRETEDKPAHSLATAWVLYAPVARLWWTHDDLYHLHLLLGNPAGALGMHHH